MFPYFSVEFNKIETPFPFCSGIVIYLIDHRPVKVFTFVLSVNRFIIERVLDIHHLNREVEFGVFYSFSHQYSDLNHVYEVTLYVIFIRKLTMIIEFSTIL